MESNYLTKAIDKKIKEFEQGKISNTELEKSVAFLLASDKTGKFISKEQKEIYMNFLDENKKYKNLKKYSTFKKGLISGVALTALSGVIAISSFGCSTQKQNNESEMSSESLISGDLELDIVKDIDKNIISKKIISPSLSFDPNDNKELVSRMTDFVADALSSGIAIKDFMTEYEIENAKQADATTIITLEQLMDYYFVLNVEDIDPEDYARLAYKTKTVDTIIENYQNVANEVNMDLLTVDYNNLIDYSRIVAHKDSAKSMNDFASLIAKYNTSTNKQEILVETRNYVNTNYITNEANIYSMPVNEQVYRFMFSFDILTNGAGITKDMGIILMEDGTYSCNKAKQNGVKNESERAQEATNIRNIVEDKLEESRKYYNQETNNLDELELKTGLELEEMIRKNVFDMNAIYVANPVYKAPIVSTTTTKKTTSTSTAKPSTVKDDNGNYIDQREFDKYNIDTKDPNAKSNYENAVKKETEEENRKSDEHVIVNPDGEEVVSGEDVNVEDYNRGFADGYFDGNNYLDKKSSGSKSYVAGYEAGYKKGREDRLELDRQLENEKESEFVPVPDGEEEVVEESVEYTEVIPTPPIPPAPIPPKPEPETETESEKESVPESSEEQKESEFVPVPDGEEEIIEEVETEYDYVESNETVVEMEENFANRNIEANVITNDTNSIQLKYLNALKSLINESSKIVEDTEEVLNRTK